jgi:hypothetical protein
MAPVIRSAPCHSGSSVDPSHKPHLQTLLDVCGAAIDILQPLLMQKEDMQIAGAQDNYCDIAEIQG